MVKHAFTGGRMLGSLTRQAVGVSEFDPAQFVLKCSISARIAPFILVSSALDCESFRLCNYVESNFLNTSGHCDSE
jgi:hypothetical protein